MSETSHEQNRENRQVRSIKTAISAEQLKKLKPQDILTIEVMAVGGETVQKEISVSLVEPIGDFYRIEGTTKKTDAGGGNTVELEISPRQPRANVIFFWE